MNGLSIEQIRSFRLCSHHLNTVYQKTAIEELVGACGMINTPPGAWETALFNRVADCSLQEMEHLLYGDKTLLQAWSLRGAPTVFPVSESDIFLNALVAVENEPWIYTAGVSLALDFLQMTFNDLFEMLKLVILNLDDKTIISKSKLDQTLAEWMSPLLSADKQELWNKPSMYGNPEKQTVGGAVVSFMLRPCAFNGLVVFGKRNGISPTFTSYKNWTGHCLETGKDVSKKLVRKFLHCYGPATVDTFVSWLGCSGKQGRRMWETVSDEIEPVMVFNKKAFILTTDKDRLFAPASFPRELLLLGGHDPYLDQRDRFVLQSDKSLHKQIWKMVSNPGVILHCGEIIGIWTGNKKGKGIEIKMTVWPKAYDTKKLHKLAEEYAAFRQQELVNVSF